MKSSTVLRNIKDNKKFKLYPESKTTYTMVKKEKAGYAVVTSDASQRSFKYDLDREVYPE